jgi:hypothetical protein
MREGATVYAWKVQKSATIYAWITFSVHRVIH